MTNDRFGVRDEDIAAEREQHKGIVRMGMYVPTRKEVLTMRADVLYPILDQWLHESPTLLIPTHEQIKDVISVLQQRPDAIERSVQKIVLECRRYIEPEGMAGPDD